jgi:hypothetical protein
MTTPPSRRRSPHVRCRLCGHVRPGWLIIPDVPDGALLVGRMHRTAFKPYLQRMAAEAIGTVAMELFERIEVEGQMPERSTP